MLTVVIIDDLNSKNKNKEDLLRCKLAATYRLVDLKGWSQNIYNHITIRSSLDSNHFFINPFGLLYSEIQASNLLKIDSKCNVIEQGSTTFGLNKAGFTLHSAIHEARPDINAIMHVHTSVGAGLSALKCGLLPISQEALICTNTVSYHDYAGILVDEPMQQQIVNDLGRKNKILILRNHGIVFCGQQIEEAYFWLMTFMIAVNIQFHALAAVGHNLDKLVVPAKHVLDQVQKIINSSTGVNEMAKDGIKWRLGEMEFEAEMRHLDLLGYQTGFDYKKKQLN